MKPYILLILGLAAGITATHYYYSTRHPAPATPQQLTLEKILSIKELHLVKHTYHDLFFLHKQNNKRKAIRAIVQVPVTVTAYLDLKEMKLIKANDTLREVVLPRARMNTPHYQVNQLVLRETRAVQVYVGRDLYPQVGNYLQTVLAERLDTVRNMAHANRLLQQAEEEGKAYVEKILWELGRPDVVVRFVSEPTGHIAKPAKNEQATVLANVPTHYFGFIPLH